MIADNGSDTENSVDINVAQIYSSFKLSDLSSIGLNINYYDYEDINLHTGLGATTTTNGNRNVAVGANQIYVNDFQMVSLGVDYKTTLEDKPFIVFIEAITNVAIGGDDKLGYIAGMKYGKLKNKKDWYVGYDYRVLEKDSTVGAFTDGESFGGGVNGNSHRLSGSYQFGNKWIFTTTLMVGEKNIADGETELRRNRLVLDVLANF